VISAWNSLQGFFNLSDCFFYAGNLISIQRVVEKFPKQVYQAMVLYVLAASAGTVARSWPFINWLDWSLSLFELPRPKLSNRPR
jgi:hypothetical protein